MDELWTKVLTALEPVIEDNDPDKKKEKLISLLTPCIIEIQIKPRYNLILVMEFLFKGLKNSEKFDKNILETTEKQIRNWVMRGDNEFSKAVSDSEQGIPNEVDRILINNLNRNSTSLLEEYSSFIPEMSESVIEERQEELIRAWKFPGNTVSIVEKPTITHSRNREITDWRGVDWSNFSSGGGGVGGAVIGEDHEELNPEFLKLNKTQERINKTYYTSIEKSLQEDTGRINALFKAYINDTKNPVKIDTDLQNIIEEFWYGKLYGDNLEFDNFVKYAKYHKISLKIKGKVDSKISRLILQAFIIALATGSNLKSIYRAVRNACEQLSYDYKTLLPENIWQLDKDIPSSNVTAIIDPVLNNIEMNPLFQFIRPAWDNMKHPKIIVNHLIEHINTNSELNILNESFKAISIITRLSVDSNGKSIDNFIQEIKRILADPKNKLGTVNKKLTTKLIKNLLKYEGQD